jgi:hypothetical protein
MEYRFKATEWKDLPAADRVRRCRLMADEAVTLAHLTSPDLAASYLRLAEDWRILAIDIDRQTHKGTAGD